MTELKENVLTVEDFKAQAGELLGVDSYMEKELIEETRNLFIQTATENGETRAEEALTLAEKAVSLIKDEEFKGILISTLLTKLSMGRQRDITKLHNKLVVAAMMEHMRNKVGNNPTF